MASTQSHSRVTNDCSSYSKSENEETQTTTTESSGCRPKSSPHHNSTQERKDHMQCTVCVEIGLSHPTHTYCFDCGRTMCETCNQNHQQISAFREHVRINLAESGSSVAEKLKSLVCKEHDHMIQKYCWSCSTPVCAVCVIFEHKDHIIKAFAYKSSEDEEKYNRLQNLIETKMSDLHNKMQMIETIKRKQAEHHRDLHQKISCHTENLMNQVSVQEHQLTERLDAAHREKQLNLQQIQQKVERAKRVVDMLMFRAGSIQQKQAELVRLQALREEVLQLEASDNQASLYNTRADASNDNDLVDTLIQQAEVVKQKQAELARLRDLREQLRQLEASTTEISQGLGCHNLKDTMVTAPEAALEATPLPQDVNLPNFTDPKVIMAIIQAIGDQIPKLREEMERSDLRTSFVPGDLDFSIGSLQLQGITQLPDVTQLQQQVQHELQEIKQLAALVTEERKEGKLRNDKKH